MCMVVLCERGICNDVPSAFVQLSSLMPAGRCVSPKAKDGRWPCEIYIRVLRVTTNCKRSGTVQ